LWLVGFKAFYLASVATAVWCWGDLDKKQYSEVNARWPQDGNPTFASYFATWDSAHYLLLSENGYHGNSPSCAFYPLWPLAIRFGAFFTGGNYLISALVLANTISLAAFVIFYQTAIRCQGKPIAKYSLIVFLVFPGSLFYQFAYSESLFLVLLMLLWRSFLARQYKSAFAAAFLLPLTRAVGLFCFVPIALHLMVHERPPLANNLLRRFKSWSILGASRIVSETGKNYEITVECDGYKRKSWYLLAAPISGWLFYLFFMKLSTGNVFEGFDAQKYWHVHSVMNMIDLKTFQMEFFLPTQFHGFTGSLLDRCVFVLFILCLPLVWKMNKMLFVWTLVLGLLPAMSGMFTSYTRFASICFPMFLAIGYVLNNRTWRFIGIVYVVVSVTFHFVLLWRYVNFKWAG
jgi:hypothetical protein